MDFRRRKRDCRLDLFLQGTMGLNIRFVVLYSKEFNHVNA
jgi:hypothetical protein